VAQAQDERSPERWLAWLGAHLAATLLWRLKMCALQPQTMSQASRHRRDLAALPSSLGGPQHLAEETADGIQYKIRHAEDGQQR
jgi:hypothetical protein